MIKLTRRQQKLKKRLRDIEARYGMVRVPGTSRSAHDDRPQGSSMRGGDRMTIHNYAPVYAKYLDPFLDDPPKTIIEVGVLTGIGLRIWSQIFPSARIIGLDIDLSNVDLSGFNRRPELYHFDMFCDNTEYIGQILAGDQVDIAIDDGAHVVQANLRTYYSIAPYLTDRAVYFIEDTLDVSNHINHKFNTGRITVI